MADFMGSMFGAQIVANAIRHQGRMARLDNQELREIANDNAILRQQNGELVDRHNRLVDAYNELLRRANALGQDYDQQTAMIERLQAQKAADARDIGTLQDRLHMVKLQLAVLRDLDKELHPEAYPLG